MTGKMLATVPGLLTVLVVSAAAGYLITHPPQTMPTATPLAPASAPPAPAPAPPAPSPSAPASATPLSAPAPPNAAVPSSAPAAPKAGGPAAGSPAHAAVPVGPPEFRVQAGAFTRREYADDLIRQLRAKGYTATIVDGPFIRVWVGPPLSRSAALRLAGNLQANGFETTLSPAR
jgi:cell division protein FtsN